MPLSVLGDVPGSIINISSVSAVRSSPGTAAYGAAKAGLLNATQSLAMEWGPKFASMVWWSGWFITLQEKPTTVALRGLSGSRICCPWGAWPSRGYCQGGGLSVLGRCILCVRCQPRSSWWRRSAGIFAPCQESRRVRLALLLRPRIKKSRLRL